MREDDYKEEMVSIILTANRWETVAHLVDMRKMHYPTPPHLQKWMKQEIISNMHPTLKRNAILLSHDFAPKIGTEQVMEGVMEADVPFETRYFSDEAEAYRWLKGAF